MWLSVWKPNVFIYFQIKICPIDPFIYSSVGQYKLQKDQLRLWDKKVIFICREGDANRPFLKEFLITFYLYGLHILISLANVMNMVALQIPGKLILVSMAVNIWYAEILGGKEIAKERMM